MILRSLRVAAWRCFANAVEIGPLGDGLNVVHGPNGSGKSTLLWALARGLFDGHKVSGADVKSLVPWGRDVNPCVRIEFEHAAARYRLDKQFIGGQRADLSRWEAGKWVALAAGTKADDFVRDLLSAEPHRGLSMAEHWGFAQVLWATQGALQIKELAGGIHNTIRDSLGAQVAGAGAEEIEARAAGEYAAIFTPKTGEFRGGTNPPRIVAVERELGQLGVQRALVADQLTAFDRAGFEIETVRSALQQSRTKCANLEAELASADAAAEKYAMLLHQRDLSRERAESANSQFNQFQARAQSIAATREALRKANELSTKLGIELTACGAALRSAEGDRDAAHSARAELSAGREQVERAQRAAQQAASYVADCAARNALAAKLDEIGALPRAGDAAAAARAKLVAPDNETLKQIKQQHQTRRDKQALLNAALIRVTIEPIQPLSIDVSAGERVGRFELAAGGALTLEGSPEVAFVIDGVGLIRAQGPAESATALRAQLGVIDERLAQLFTGLGTDDVAVLEEHAEQARRLDHEIQQSRQQQARMLGGQSLAAIESQQASLQSTIDAAKENFPHWATEAPNAQDLAERARQLTDAQRTAEQTEINRQAAADDAYNQQYRQHAELAAKFAAAQDTAQRSTENLQQLTSDGLNDAAREAQLNQAALTWHAAQAALTAVSDQLGEFASDPRETPKNMRHECESLRTTAERDARLMFEHETRLKSIVELAPYSKLVEIDEAVARLQEEFAREQLRTSAIRLLHSTIQTQKTAAVSAIIAPVEHHANTLLQRIAGGRFETITIGDKLLPTGVRPKLHAEQVSLGYLSGGEQEQVHFAVRLALAEAAFGDERQLVVLDDAFTATDAARLRQIADILRETSQRFQIVLLSCHPERYAHLQEVRFFDLERLTTATAEEHAA